MKKNRLIKTLMAFSVSLSLTPVSSVFAVDDGIVEGNYQQAIESIVIPRYETDGTKTEQKVSETLKAKLDDSNLKATVNTANKTLTVDTQLKDVYLASDYLNGVSPAGESYYNMMNFYTDVIQVDNLLRETKYQNYNVIDNTGEQVSGEYIDSLLGLLKQINDFDTSTNLQYDMNSQNGTDVIATSEDGKATFKFHIDSHGYWGYDLGAHDSITGIVMGYSEDEAYERQSELTTLYGNFFKIEFENKGSGKWYLLRNTDLQCPAIYVSEDGKEAFMIDVDFYGENVINKVIKEIIGDDCESLKIFLTHNHGDHVNNLAKIAEDSALKDIVTLYWPENEPHPKKDGVDLVELFDNVKLVKDMETFTVAGNEFQFIEIPDEHTPAGGQLADLTNNVLYSGDTLGAQVHLGGTTVSLSALDSWIDGVQKSVDYIQAHDMQYIIGGHTPYLNTSDFASWVHTALVYAKNQLAKDSSWQGGLVIVENGKVVDANRQSEMLKNGLTDAQELKVASVNFRNDLPQQSETIDVEASYQQAIESIVVPRYEADGTKTEQRVSETLKAKLDDSNLKATVNTANKTLTVDTQLKDVYLASDYLNGVSPAGESYYNMMNFYTDVKQVAQLLEKYNGYTVIDNKGQEVNADYVQSLLGLLDQINSFDTKTNLKYDMNSQNGTDVIATSKDGNATFKFHIDSHGYWGYDLGAHDSITGIVMGLDEKEANEKQHEYTMKYGNFFKIELENKGSGKWYLLRNTDLQCPVIYVSEDGKEAFMIDVDFYGSYVINDVIKSIIGDKCESLKIFLTHNHGDHVNNLAAIAQDKELKDIVTLYWPENEPHPTLTAKDTVYPDMVGQDLVELFDDVKLVKDMEKFTVAGNEFQFIEIPDEHTPAGGQLADLTNNVLYSGDTLGAQVHLGGTTVSLSALDSWIDGVQKSVDYIQAHDMKYIIGGHTPYLNTSDFASWVHTALVYAKDQLAKDSSWQGGLVIVENGKVVDANRQSEMFKNGLTDAQELKVASVNFRNDLSQEEEISDSHQNQDSSTKTDQNNTKNPIQTSQNVKTDDTHSIGVYVFTAFIACVVGVVIYRKRHG